MKKGLYIKDNIFLNLENVITWQINDDSINFTIVGPEMFDTISVFVEGKDAPEHTPKPYYYVPPNELHRMKREINLYMGI
jgi:hypothetical protein